MLYQEKWIVFCDARVEDHAAFFAIVGILQKNDEIKKIEIIKKSINPKTPVFLVERKAVEEALSCFPYCRIFTDNLGVLSSFDGYKNIEHIYSFLNPAHLILEKKFKCGKTSGKKEKFMKKKNTKKLLYMIEELLAIMPKDEEEILKILDDLSI